MWVYIQETSLLPFLHLKMETNSLLLLFKPENKKHNKSREKNREKGQCLGYLSTEAQNFSCV